MWLGVRVIAYYIEYKYELVVKVCREEEKLKLKFQEQSKLWLLTAEQAVRVPRYHQINFT